MTRQERVSKYMEILDKHDEGNSFWNWEILDELSDEELFDENKIAEKIHIIQKHQTRLESNSNKYSESIMECVRQRWGLEKYDDSRDKEINELSPDEILEHVCNWNGLIGYASIIKSWIEDIYKTDIVVENRQLRQEVKRLSEVEKEYHDYVMGQCRESEKAVRDIIRIPLENICFMMEKH